MRTVHCVVAPRLVKTAASTLSFCLRVTVTSTFESLTAYVCSSAVTIAAASEVEGVTSPSGMPTSVSEVIIVGGGVGGGVAGDSHAPSPEPEPEPEPDSSRGGGEAEGEGGGGDGLGGGGEGDGGGASGGVSGIRRSSPEPEPEPTSREPEPTSAGTTPDPEPSSPEPEPTSAGTTPDPEPSPEPDPASVSWRVFVANCGEMWEEGWRGVTGRRGGREGIHSSSPGCSSHPACAAPDERWCVLRLQGRAFEEEQGVGICGGGGGCGGDGGGVPRGPGSG